MKKDKTFYASVDIETDGPIPSEYSMISLGAAVCTIDDGIIDKFKVNLNRLEGASQHPKTMEWWETKPEAWSASTSDPRHPKIAIRMFCDFLKPYKRPVFVGYPAGFDFTFVYWYLIKFNGSSPFSFSALDIKTLAAAKIGVPYRDAVKRNMPKYWFGKTPHTHDALDDAVGQAELFLNIMRA